MTAPPCGLTEATYKKCDGTLLSLFCNVPCQTCKGTLMTNPTSNPCPECGKPLPADSPRQLCAACLMAQAFVSGTFQPEGEPAQAPAPTPEEIAGRFPQLEITECLGRGGMGIVYKARQKSLDRWVALKLLAPERVGQEKFAERFAREAATLAKLSHPNIVTIHDFGQTEGLFYLVMEFVDGVNLRELLRDGKLDPKQALAIVPPICDALQYAHDKGIVHRDIKPENLLLDREGRVKIADFGIAALVGAVGELAGTPAYMAPEQSQSQHEVDNRADIYALGAVLYEMLTGDRPGKELIAPSRKVQIDVRLDEIVLRALEKKPELRYQQASALKTQLETVSQQPQQEPPLAQPAPATPEPRAEAGVAVAPPSNLETPSPLGESELRDLRRRIGSGILFCFFASVGMASHLPPGSKPMIAIGAWGLFFLGATLLALFAAGNNRRKLAIAKSLNAINQVGTSLALVWGILQIPWMVRPWRILLVCALACNALGHLAQLLKAVLDEQRRGGFTASPLQQRIWLHMNGAEKREAFHRELMFSVWNVATWFGPIAIIFLSHSQMRWLYAGIVLAIGLSGFPLWGKILREGISSSAWARERGISAEDIKKARKAADTPLWIRLVCAGAFGAGLVFLNWILVPNSNLPKPVSSGVTMLGTMTLTFLFMFALQWFNKNVPAIAPEKKSQPSLPRFSRMTILGLVLGGSILLLALDALIGVLLFHFGIGFLGWTQNYNETQNSQLIAMTLVFSAVADFFIARAAWRAICSRPL